MEKNLAKHSVKENFENFSAPFSFFLKLSLLYELFIVPVKVIFFSIVIAGIVILSYIWKKLPNYKKTQ